jgi:hypothetical protein
MQLININCNSASSNKSSVAFRPYLAISLALSSLNHANLTLSVTRCLKLKATPFTGA